MAFGWDRFNTCLHLHLCSSVGPETANPRLTPTSSLVFISFYSCRRGYSVPHCTHSSFYLAFTSHTSLISPTLIPLHLHIPHPLTSCPTSTPTSPTWPSAPRRHRATNPVSQMPLTAIIPKPTVSMPSKRLRKSWRRLPREELLLASSLLVLPPPPIVTCTRVLYVASLTLTQPNLFTLD